MLAATHAQFTAITAFTLDAERGSRSARNTSRSAKGRSATPA
jgi:hypothetical protein